MLKRWIKNCMIWKLEDKVSIQTPVKGVDFCHKFFQLDENGNLLINEGYAWNGCSPKVVFLSMVFGTPEGSLPTKKEKDEIIANLRKLGITQFSWDRPKTYYASLVHDTLYQIGETRSADMTKNDIDRLFYSLLKAYKFKPAEIYYLAVKVFGGSYWGRISK